MPDPAANDLDGLAYEDRIDLRVIQLRGLLRATRASGRQGVTLPAKTIESIADMLESAAQRLRQEGA